jgi:hypothetical protein
MLKHTAVDDHTKACTMEWNQSGRGSINHDKIHYILFLTLVNKMGEEL